jgi:menaquinone-specific isochorismate synthase
MTSLAPLGGSMQVPRESSHGLYDEARAELRLGLSSSLARCPQTARRVVLTVPAPHLRLGAAMHLFSDFDERFVWAPDRGPGFVGAGDAVALRPPALEQAAARLWPTIFHAAHVDTLRETGSTLEAPFSLRLFGGLAFSSASIDENWKDFGLGLFVLPRWLYRRDHHSSTLSLVVDAGPADRSFEVELDQALDSLLARLAASSEASGHHLQLLGRIQSQSVSPAEPRAVIGDEAAEQLARQEWLDLITPLRDAIRQAGPGAGTRASGSAQEPEAQPPLLKVVAARVSEIEIDDSVDLEAVLTRLGRGAPTCTRFAFLRGGSTFLGSTPERLVRKRGRSVETEALAGTIEKDRSGADLESLSQRLSESVKDLHEHELVVEHILDRLRPISSEVRCQQLTEADGSKRPIVRVLGNVLHLETPIRATLDDSLEPEQQHVLSLVARLHPTPAVGGIPVEQAVAWIEHVEALTRGWYAAPIGWFDERGDGDFSVALRCCLITSRDDGRRLARVYAGAGIVDASDPESEWRETEVKQATVREALGLGSGSV